MWPALYLPKGEPKHEKLDLRTTDLVGLLLELEGILFSGQIEILSPHEHGLLLFHAGSLYNGFYDGTEDLQLTPLQVVEHFLQRRQRGSDTLLNVSALPEAVIEALGALQTRQPVYRELETSFLNMEKLFQTLTDKGFTGCLRFYRVRSHTRLGNLLVKMNKITHDQLQEAVRLQLARKQGLRLGDALVENGAISAEDLKDALALQSHARKGSDVEIALALFVRGKFLGSYTHMHRQLDPDLDGVRSELGDAEVLMDILEGGLPEAVPLEPLLRPKEAPRAAGSAPHELADGATPAPPKTVEVPAEEPFEDAMSLHGEELVLDLPLDLGHLAGPLSPEPNDTTPPSVPEEEATVPDGEAHEPASPVPIAPAPEPGNFPEHLEGWPYLLAVVERYMGHLGRRLVEHEAKGLHAPGKEWTPAQLSELNERLARSAPLILGATRARRMTEQVRERLG